MANASYDTLTIKINADSKQANASISRLETNLRKLDETAKNVNTRRIGEVKGLLLNIAKIDFSNVSKGLQDVVSAFKAFNSKSFMKLTNGGVNLTNAFKMPDMSKLGNIENVTKLPDLAGIEKFTSELKQIPPIKELADSKGTFDLNEKLKEIGLSAEQVKTVMNSIKTSVSVLSSDQIDKVKTALKQAGLSAKQTEIAVKKLNTSMKSSTKNTVSAMTKTWKNFTSLLRNRILRKLIQTIYQSMTKGIQNVAQFDKKTNEAMSSVKSSFSYLVNSLGTLLAPIMQILAPIIQSLSQMLGGLIGHFAELFSAMAGNKTYLKAKEQVKDYADALKKTQTIGIDELNVLQQEDTGMFEEVAVSDEMLEKAKGFKEIFEGIKGIISFIGEIVDSAFKESGSSILSLIKSILGVIMSIVDVLKPLISNTMGSIHQSLGNFTEMIASILDLIGTIIYELKDVLAPIMEIIGIIINLVNEVLSTIFKVVKEIIEIIKPIIQLLLKVISVVLKPILNIILTIFYVLEAIVKTILYLISFQWDKIGGVWEEMGNKTKNAWNGNTNIGDVDRFATGGFPEDGFFYANHTELVGTFSNGKTAVANNEQIIEGIKQGVKEALAESESGNITIEMDGYEVAKVVSKKQTNRGIDVLKGGKVNFGY